VNHYTSPEFWKLYGDLPPEIQAVADKNYELLKANRRHPSLHFKSVGKLVSVRVGTAYRALGTPVDDGVLWFWIGSHDEYDSMV
jgi:hypothetical protein